MPHVEIKCFPGRTEEQKALCAEKIAEVLADAWDCKMSSVSVAIKDVPKDQWKENVWDAQIMADEPYLYKSRGIRTNEVILKFHVVCRRNFGNGIYT